MQVWQIACGEAGRYYDDLFLDHDVMFLGPGRPGKYDRRLYRAWAESGRISKSSSHKVAAFAERVQPGDIVLLRKGYRVLSIGQAEGHTYHWNESLDDIHGWDLQHCRSVSWQRQLDPELAALQEKKDLFSRMKQISTFTRVRQPRFLDPIRHLFSRVKRRPPKAPPKAPEPMSMADLGEKLFGAGLPNDAVDRVVRAVERQRRLVQWYAIQGSDSKRPTEHEVVAHMVLPLLLALGWSEQLLAVEWHKIDLAAFSTTPTTSDKCVLVCEAKHVGHGLQNVLEQAHAYVKNLKLASCKNILLTEGARFYLYQKGSAGWPTSPTGYFNVERLREDHVTPRGTSAVNTIAALTPMNVMRT
jgi:hypothetical protein